MFGGLSVTLKGSLLSQANMGQKWGLFTANSHRIKGTRASKFGDNCKTLLCPLPFSQNNKLPQYHLLEHFIGHQKAIKIWSFLESSTKSALKMSHLYECWCSINGNPVIPKVFGLREVQAGGMHGFFFLFSSSVWIFAELHISSNPNSHRLKTKAMRFLCYLGSGSVKFLFGSSFFFLR